MSFTKVAHAAALKKVAEVETVQRQHAFEAGFAKVAGELQLSEAEYNEFYGIAVADLNKTAAAAKNK